MKSVNESNDYLFSHIVGILPYVSQNVNFELHPHMYYVIPFIIYVHVQVVLDYI